ncbi:hypothetical protein [Streptomyces olivaceus]|uniref:hypothetical protein n=1 Tax=Streptomyces olivaceus TaxID=47716 RepID=UPI0036B109C1
MTRTTPGTGNDYGTQSDVAIRRGRSMWGKITASQTAIKETDRRHKIIHEGDVRQGRTWNESMQCRVLKVQLESSHTYYLLTISDQAGADEEELLDDLEAELGKPLADCVVESETINRPHSKFRGSASFRQVTLYAG